MTIIESIRNFIETCPFLDDFRQAVNVEFLGENAKSYMLESTPVEPLVKRYMDGSSVMQYAFVFASREYYGPDVMENIENSGFYEHFAQWLDECTLDGNLPVMEDDKTAKKITATTTGYVFNTDETKAMYQIQCKLIYFQERKDGLTWQET